MTRDNFIIECRAAADATGSGRWSDTTILHLADVLFDAEWDELYAAAPHYRISTLTLTPDASGRVLVSALTTGSADAEKNFHRIVHVRRGTVIYAPGNLQEQPLATADQALALGNPRYWRDGDYIQLSPASASDAIQFTLRYTPTPPSELAGGNSAIDYPSPMVLAFGVAGLMLQKGGQESREGLSLLRTADILRDKLLAKLSRLTTGPTVWAFSDSPVIWGGQ